MRAIALVPVVALSLALPSTGCFYNFEDRSDPPPAPTRGTSSSEPSTTTVGQAESMSGRVGRTPEFSTARVEMRLTQRSTQSTVRFDTLDAHGRWVMANLTVSGADGIYNRAFSPGARLSFRNGVSAAEGVRLSVLGCTGSARNNWDWDHSTQTVDVTVTEGPSPESVRVTYVAVFDDASGSHEIRGTFIRDPE
ncbi:MAG: hypothetical protein R3A52_13170 [Polyangiales bacterium]